MKSMGFERLLIVVAVAWLLYITYAVLSLEKASVGRDDQFTEADAMRMEELLRKTWQPQRVAQRIDTLERENRELRGQLDRLIDVMESYHHE